MAGTPPPTTATTSSGQLVAYDTRPMLCLPSPVQPTPLPVVKLEMNTNLNVPPLNAWSLELSDTFRAAAVDNPGTSQGTTKATTFATTSGAFTGNGNGRSASRQWRSNARTKDCFESLRLADCYIDALVGGVDVVAEAETLKKLIATPFSKQPLSLIVHKIGKTLLLDNCAYLRNYSCKHAAKGTSPVAEFLNSKSQSLVGTSSGANRTTGDIIADMHREMIAENLYTRSLAPLEYKPASEHPDISQQGRSGSENELPKMVNENGLADPLEDYPFTKIRIDDSEAELDGYGRIWNFYDLNILVDVNLPIFGCKSNPCVTLHPKDLKHRPINFLTGVDLYLDQSMCNAPEALLCWHMGGYVKEYEVIRTEDIPHLENAKFDPQILRNVAENIVAFLQDKVAQEGHTYWLCHDKGDSDHEPLLRLWDLTPLCGDLLEDSTANPFTLSVGILIYKVARNLMRRSAHKRPKRIANAAFRLLNVCLGIIDREKHPQVVACVYYLLANLYLSYGCDAVKRSAGQEDELERAEPQWAYDDRWQREYGEEYASYAAISIESLKKTRYTGVKREKPPKLRTLPNCATTEDCCKEALEHCLEGLRYMDLFDEMEQAAQRAGKPLHDPMSFIRDVGVNIDQGREEADAMLKVDVRSILFIRAGSAYRMLADSSFVLSRFGRTLRFARVGLYCCLAVLSLNVGLTGGHAQRNVATARALLPAMMCHIAEAIGNIACSSMPMKDQAKADLKRCYRDKQIKAQALACLKNRHESSLTSAETIATLQSSSSFDDSGEEIGSEVRDTESQVLAPEFEAKGRTRVRAQVPELENQACSQANDSDATAIGDSTAAANPEEFNKTGKDRPYSWAFPKSFHLPFVDLMAISERASSMALSWGKKIAPMTLFPPTADAILYQEQLARRLGNLKNCLAMHYIHCLKGFVQRAAQKGTKLFTDKETVRNYVAMEVGELGVGDVADHEHGNTMDPEQLIEKTVEFGKELLLEGVSLFNSFEDRINESFLLSNIGQFYRLQLHCQMYFTDFGAPYNPEKEKNSVLQAIEYYQRALTSAAEFQSTQFPLFENISKELAGTYFTYAVRLQDNVQPGVTGCDPQKLSIEIREFLARAQSAYTLIRDSSKCSPKMNNLAEQFIVEIMFRYGKLAQQTMQQHGAFSCSSRKQRECRRQAVEHYNACFKYVLGRITGSTAKVSQKQQPVSFWECLMALRAVVEGNICSGSVVPCGTTHVRLMHARHAMAALFVETKPLMRYLRAALNFPEERKKEIFEFDSLGCQNSYSGMLHNFVQYARLIVRDVLQCLMESGINARTATVLELWKNIYRQLLQIQTADENCNLLLCLEKLIDCADHINSCFENL